MQFFLPRQLILVLADIGFEKGTNQTRTTTTWIIYFLPVKVEGDLASLQYCITFWPSYASSWLPGYRKAVLNS